MNHFREVTLTSGEIRQRRRYLTVSFFGRSGTIGLWKMEISIVRRFEDLGNRRAVHRRGELRNETHSVPTIAKRKRSQPRYRISV